MPKKATTVGELVKLLLEFHPDTVLVTPNGSDSPVYVRHEVNGVNLAGF